MGLGLRIVCIPGAPMLVSVGRSVQHVVYKYDAQKKKRHTRSKQLEEESQFQGIPVSGRGGEFKVSRKEQ